MHEINLDRGWEVADASYFNIATRLREGAPRTINLPYDTMVEGNTDPAAPGATAYAWYTATPKTFTRWLSIPEDWKDDRIWLHFDGVMGQAVPELNGYQFGVHHYGYTPFNVDLTGRLSFGGKQQNRFSLVVNPGQEPGSRWYPGQGLIRSVALCHAPMISIASDGIWSRTDYIDTDEDGVDYAHLTHEITVENDLSKDHIVRTTVSLIREDTKETVLQRSTAVMVNGNATAIARIPMTVPDPRLWDEHHPLLYLVEARVEDLGIYTTHLQEETADPSLTYTDRITFGIRTIRWDARHGLRIGGLPVKLKGGCQHHDNGVIGAASYYDAEYRRLRKLKEAGYNAVRTSHNPPSAALLDAADRLGMYLFDEAFDIWNMSKTAGDYSLYFHDHWKSDIAAFVKRDRNHPSVIMWSTGNEITDRGGLTNGYVTAAELADYIRSLDPTRPVSNAVCSYWAGIDDELLLDGMPEAGIPAAPLQNADVRSDRVVWEKLSEPFAAPLDIVGYNYMEDQYEPDLERFPERLILGTESFPNHIDRIWALVKKHPAIIGDFTWTSWDYLGEVGIGQALYLEADDPRIAKGPRAVSSRECQYPWRTSNDADFDITGWKLAQGVYRSIVWGSKETGLFSCDPAVYGKTELISRWGWPAVTDCWTWNGQEGRPVTLLVYSGAPEVEVLVNGRTLGRKPAGEACRYTAAFETTYAPGEVTAISYDAAGNEVSRTSIHTAGAPAAVRLTVDTIGTVPAPLAAAVSDRRVQTMIGESPCQKGNLPLRADGHSLAFIYAEAVDAEGRVVPYADTGLTATVTGAGDLLGFGSGAPITKENYTAGHFAAYRGRALAVVRGGYEPGNLTLTVAAGDLGSSSLHLKVE